MRYRKPLVLIGLALAFGQSWAIEAPQSAEIQTQAAEAPNIQVTPSDEIEFYIRLQHSTHWRNLRGLNVPEAVIQNLSEGRADLAVGALNTAAAQGSEAANIALVRIQHWCGRVGSARAPNTQEQISKLSPVLSAQRAARAAGVIMAEAVFLPRAAEGCRNARFDYGAIEDRLRDAADSGKPASATELAQFTRDPKKRDALLELATSKQYAPALYVVATRRVIDVQRAERTEDVASIRLFLKQAGRSMPKAKVDLANCMALGCDGHPADAASAVAFATDAARDGEPTAFLSMTRMAWGRRIPRLQLLAWQQFGDRLNEAGCMGDAYITQAVGFAHSIKALSKGLDDTLLAQAQEQAEQLWKDNSTRARKEQGCSTN